MTADQILSILWRRRLVFVATFVLVLGAVALVTFSLPKVYSTTTYLIVEQRGTAGNAFEAAQVNEVQTRTYAELLQTRNVATDVARAMPYRISADAVLASTDAAVVSQSQLLSITAEAGSPRRAQQLADTYAGVFVRRTGQDTESGTTLRVAERAPLADAPTRPQPRLYLLVGMLVALVAAAAVALLRHRLDQRLDIDPDTAEIMDLPVIARIPQRRSGQHGHEEAYRFLLANLAFANGGKRPESIAVVSANEGEGKSTTSFNLALAASELGISVALVDADLRRPSLSRVAELPIDAGQAGLSTFLAGGATVAITDLAVTVPGTLLEVIPAGPMPPNPAALLGSQGLADFAARARRVYDLVVFDTPPLTVGADASLVVAAVDGAVMVIDPARAKRSAVARAVEQLHRVKSGLLGVALNRVAENQPAYNYRGEAPAQEDGGRRSRAARPDTPSRR